jgi:hypothetical protein
MNPHADAYAGMDTREWNEEMNPFVKYREHILAQDIAGAWLRSVVLSLYKSDHHTALKTVTLVDNENLMVFQHMMAFHRLHWKDPAFVALAEECSVMLREVGEAAQELRSWLSQVKASIIGLGFTSGEVDKEFLWFEGDFKQGLTPAEAAVGYLRKVGINTYV